MSIRVLVIDDSAAMRRLISAVLNSDREIEVVGEAANAVEARQALASLKPDIATLDMEMPGLHGVELIADIRASHSLPIIVVAARPDAETREKALAAGAFEVLDKPGLGSPEGHDFAQLVRQIKSAARQRGRYAAPSQDAPPRHGIPLGSKSFAPSDCIVGIGGSAGGIEALTVLVSKLPTDCPPILVVQHIPPSFVPQLAERLDKACALKVELAAEGCAMQRGKIYLAPGDRHLCLQKGAGGWRGRLEAHDPVHGFRPSIDVLFSSMARAAGARSIGVVLSGMGRDGVSGLMAIRQAGGRTFGQDQATSAVYGIPRAAHEAGAVEKQASPERLAAHILRLAAGEHREAP